VVLDILLKFCLNVFELCFMYSVSFQWTKTQQFMLPNQIPAYLHSEGHSMMLVVSVILRFLKVSSLSYFISLSLVSFFLLVQLIVIFVI